MSNDPSHLEQIRHEWGGQDDLWVFAYASLIWRPDMEVTEQRLARVHGWHRALAMWSRINRGTPERPGLVFALLGGGSCQGLVLRVPRAHAHEALEMLWSREMPMKVYTPRWLTCHTPHGPVKALAFTLPKSSPSHTGKLSTAQYRDIFSHTQGGRYGNTLDYARQTQSALQALGIQDQALNALLALAPAPQA
jgi:cation transport protein ChaC